LVFIIGSLIGRKERAVNLQIENEIAVNQEKLSDLVSKDSDGDGVPDWEEALWGTDPYKKDTSGDGIPDNIEIENKKKDLRESGVELSAPDVDISQLNETERFSREFFTTFMALRESGNLSPEAIANLSVSLAKTISDPKEEIDFFALKDLQINTDPAYTPKAYALAVKTAASKFAGQKLGSEMEILAKGITEESEAAMAELSSIGESYGKLALELKSVPVPPELSEDHLVLVNSALGMSKTVQNLSQVLVNPLGAMPSLSEYAIFNTRFIEIADKIDELLK